MIPQLLRTFTGQVGLAVAISIALTSCATSQLPSPTPAPAKPAGQATSPPAPATWPRQPTSEGPARPGWIFRAS